MSNWRRPLLGSSATRTSWPSTPRPWAVPDPPHPQIDLALLLLLQQQAGCSDEEVIERSAFDLHWAAVLGRHAGAALCAGCPLGAEARRAGLLEGGKLKVAVDTKPMLGRGAVEDTCNLLATGLQQVIRVLAKVSGETLEAWVARQGLQCYFAPSLRGTAELDGSDPAARQQFLSGIVADARRLLHWASYVEEEDRAKVKEACGLLEQLLVQDVQWQEPPGQPLRAELKEGTAPDRVPSATDPEQRHGHKSQSQRFTGHKVAVVVDRESQLILDGEVLAGNAGDAEGVLEAVERVEQVTGQAVEETVGDGAYGSGATRQAFQDAGRALVVRPPRENGNGGRFPKSAFEIDLEGDRVTCPAGKTASQYQREKDGGKLFHIGSLCEGCALRSQCTTSALGGRSGSIRRRRCCRPEPTSRPRKGGRCCESGWWQSRGWPAWVGWGWDKLGTSGAARAASRSCWRPRSRTCAGPGTGQPGQRGRRSPRRDPSGAGWSLLRAVATFSASSPSDDRGDLRPYPWPLSRSPEGPSRPRF